MNKKILISPSILAAPHETQEEINEAVEQAEQGGADLLHIDVMDGQFVPQTTLWNEEKNIKKIRSKLPLDVHLMIQAPEERYLEFVHAGASMISFHIEACKDPEVLLSKLHKWHIKVGIAINPETPIEKLLPYLPLIDYVLVMSVHPGKAGQTFIPATLEKLITIKQQRTDIPLQIDGGINKDTIALVTTAGANILVAGSAIYKEKDKKRAIKELREEAQKNF